MTNKKAAGYMKRIVLAILLLMLLIPSLANAKSDHYEKWYQSRWCKTLENVCPKS